MHEHLIVEIKLYKRNNPVCDPTGVFSYSQAWFKIILV